MSFHLQKNNTTIFHETIAVKLGWQTGRLNDVKLYFLAGLSNLRRLKDATCTGARAFSQSSESLIVDSFELYRKQCNYADVGERH